MKPVQQRSNKRSRIMKETKAILVSRIGGELSRAVLDPQKKATVRFERPSGESGVLYHQTVVVLKKSNGQMVLDSGGWKTPTTKNRINDELPPGYCVGQEKGVWYLHSPEGNKVAFYDGIVVDPNKPLVSTKKAEVEERVQKKLGKQVLNLVSKLDDLDQIPQPCSSDCLFCQSRDDSRTHILGHVKSGDVVNGSMVVNALQWAGIPDEGISLMYKMGLKSRVKSTLRRYLRAKLGLVR